MVGHGTSESVGAVSLVRTSALIAAPIELVFDLARDVGVHAGAWARTGAQAVATGVTEGRLSAGDLVSLRYRRFGVSWRYDARVVVCEPPNRLVDVQDHGPWRSMRHEQRLVETGAGTLLLNELSWHGGPGAGLLDGLVLRRHLRRLLLVHDTHLRQVAERRAAAQEATATPMDAAHGVPDVPVVPAVPADAVGAGPGVAVVVVAVALLDEGGRVLAARRRNGGWEFPGGKVEAGESDEDALVRECREELGVEVTLTGRLGRDEPIPPRDYGAATPPTGAPAVLRLWTGRVTHGEPTPHVHRELRWLAVDELPSVDWLPADRPFLPALAATLGAQHEIG